MVLTLFGPIPSDAEIITAIYDYMLIQAKIIQDFLGWNGQYFFHQYYIDD